MKKKHRTGNKLQQKVSQHILVVLSVIYNILKVYQSLTTRNAIFRPRSQRVLSTDILVSFSLKKSYKINRDEFLRFLDSIRLPMT